MKPCRDRDTTFDRPAPFGRYRVNLDAIDMVGVLRTPGARDGRENIGRSVGQPV
jgi:hypothetical protein